MSIGSSTRAGTADRAPVRTPRLPAPLHYTLHSFKLTVKNVSFTTFSLATPVILYVVFSQIFGQVGTDPENTWETTYMVSMGAYGALGAATVGGAQLAVERRSGWFRQLSISTLRPRQFLLAKAGVVMLLVLPALLLVFTAGVLVGGVRAPVPAWPTALGLMWIALLPVALLGLAIGLWVRAETVQGLTTLVLLVLSMLGGLWFPARLMPAALQRVAELLPSYWIAEFGRYPFLGGPFPWQGVLVLGVWTAALTVLGALGYRRAAANSKR